VIFASEIELVSEVLRFSGDVVIEGHGTYIVAE
jgi:hypothetical protein